MFRFGVAVAAILFVVDQASKLYVHDLLAGDGLVARAALPFLNLVTVWNHGISFGLFNVAEGVVRWLFPFPALATWHKPTALRSAAALLALRPARLAVGHGPVLVDPAPAMAAAVAKAERKFGAP